jgi:mRNA turnover protein 4
MPKSKRSRVIHTSKVLPKGKSLSIRTFSTIQSLPTQYPYLYIVSISNPRNTHLNLIRTSLSSSRLFFGKTKVIATALGKNADSEPARNTHLLAPHMKGAVGCLFSEHKPEYILDWFEKFHPLDYARAGTVASREFVIPAGVVYSRGGEIPAEADVAMAHSIEPTLRKLGVPTRLVKGKIMLGEEGGEGYVVCREGEVLGSGQTTLLKMFGIEMAEFAVEIKAYWERETGKVVVLGEGAGDGGGGGGMDVDSEEDVLVDDEE